MSNVHESLVAHNRFIHNVLRRSLDTAASRATDLRGADKQAFLGFVECMEIMFHAHHLSEDELLLPAMRQKKAEGPWDQVATEHKEMSAIFERVKASRTKAALSEGAMAELAAALEELKAQLTPHLAMEEERLTRAFWEATFDEQEAKDFGKRIADHSQKHAVPAPRLLPFILFNLDPAERAEFSRALPGFLTKVLVPYAWYFAWKPMRPFFAFSA